MDNSSLGSVRMGIRSLGSVQTDIHTLESVRIDIRTPEISKVRYPFRTLGSVRISIRTLPSERITIRTLPNMEIQNCSDTPSITVPVPVSLEPGMIVTNNATCGLDKPLYEGAKISVKESICSILTYNQTEHCSGVGLRRLLNLVNLHLPEKNNLPDTTDKLYDIFPESDVPYTLHFYCNKCWGRRSSVNDICTECDVTNKKVEYFITFSLVSQIQNLFKKEGFVKLLNYKKQRQKINEDNYEDILDGDLYKEAEKILQDFDLTVTWNSDGVSLYESSNFDIWPFYFVINELPPSERYKTENMLLAGIWGSKDHPHPNIFLHPIVDQMKIMKSGVSVEDDAGGNFTVHVYVLCGTCDLPARAAFLNMNGHMGYSSCPFCLIAGERSKRTGDAMVFPHETVLLERTDEIYKRQIEDAVAVKQSVEGPLWAFNCFLFEDLNGRLAAMVHGTNHACMQVARSLTMAQRLPVLIESLSDGCAKIFCEKLLYKWKRQSINEYLQPGTFSVGKYNEAVSYPDLLKELLSNLYGFLPHFLTFHRLYHCKQLFVAKSYSRSSRVSSHVKYRLVSTNFGEILTFVRVAHQDVLKMFALVKKIDVVPFNDSGHAPHIMYCVPREDIELVPVSHLLGDFDDSYEENGARLVVRDASGTWRELSREPATPPPPPRPLNPLLAGLLHDPSREAAPGYAPRVAGVRPLGPVKARPAEAPLEDDVVFDTCPGCPERCDECDGGRGRKTA
ncbi:U1 small nuclear ribonucleoprotein C [Frankliniella fusca]|uniref:U1 small nuclear ribonucleoprotein C n=1 Tax=Frankliniella fusca TaxID=407009 RepID=A0AAE1H1M8_9NEOP|nr:U1 small nuclear ribonucleoprotein C [Frankliniella fusca]